MVDAVKIVALAMAMTSRTVDGLDALANKVVERQGRAAGAARAQRPRDLRADHIVGRRVRPGRRRARGSGPRSSRAFSRPAMAPWAIVLDPALTRHTPEWLWLSTGVRSLDHAIETAGLLPIPTRSRRRRRNCDQAARRGLAGEQGRPGPISTRASIASLVPGNRCCRWSSGIPMGASHAISHAVGSTHGVPHGHTSCVMLPRCWRGAPTMTADGRSGSSAALGMAGGAGRRGAARFAPGARPGRTRLRDVGVSEADFSRALRARRWPNQWIPHRPPAGQTRRGCHGDPAAGGVTEGKEGRC